jgi:hypothetical protein
MDLCENTAFKLITSSIMEDRKHQEAAASVPAAEPASAPTASAVPASATQTPKKGGNTVLIIILVIVLCSVLACCAPLALTFGAALMQRDSNGVNVPGSDTNVTPTVKTGTATQGSAAWKTEVATYSTGISDISRKVAGGLSGFGNFLTTKPDYTKWTASEKEYVLGQMRVIKTGYTDIQKLSVPAGMEDIHKTITDAMRLYSNSMDKFESAMNTGSTKDMNDAITLMQQANDKTKSATDMLRDFKEDNGL